MSQKIEYVDIKNLVLWTENPRDPIDSTASDQDIISKAISDMSSKWELAKLAKNMGKRYDFSEIPTVVLHNKKPVVYDGNRRVALGKIKHGMVHFHDFDKNIIPDFPEIIPCNVCSKEIALDNVWRKHADTGSWGVLERDIFAHKHREEEKSKFLLLDEATGIVSNNPHLNKRFVKEEIFREDELNRLGIEFKDGSIYTKHTQEETLSLLNDISSKVANKEITTRKNRGKIHDILDTASLEIIKKNKSNKLNPISINNSDNPAQDKPSVRQSKRTQAKTIIFFGRKLYLRSGDVNNLYRDIVNLYEFYLKEKERLSEKFPAIIRMVLRLLCEAAPKDKKTKMGNYIKN